MTVGELIEELKKHDPARRAWVGAHSVDVDWVQEDHPADSVIIFGKRAVRDEPVT